MKDIKIFILLLIGLCTIKCTKQIDEVPLDFNGIDVICSDSVYVRQFVNNIYNSLPTGYNRMDNSMIASATDEGVQSSNSSPANSMAKGIWGPSSNPDSNWGSNYDGIRKTNIYLLSILPNIPEKVFRSQTTINVLTGQVLFLRAMFHFELIKRYGGIPVDTTIFVADSETNTPRNTYDESINFIAKQCDKAASLLPAAYPVTELGRITKGAAYALKARALLYAASPLFNDPGQSNDSYNHGAFSLAKWEKAAAAANQVISLNQYVLFTPYENFFTTLTGNNEIILSRIAGASNSIEKLNGPSGYTGGGGGTGPSLNLVDAYEMSNGTKFDWNNLAMSSNPFANRDPRFYKSILYNGLLWMGDTISTYIGGNDLGSLNSTRTSFYLRKFLSESAKWYGVTGTTFHCFPIFRYGEVLLNYAESMNEAYGPEIDTKGYGMTAKKAIEMIRQRAGINPFTLKSALTKVEMRDIIRHERQIELVFEEHRHLDVRRWKIAENTLGVPVYGLKITKNINGSFSYEKVKIEDRVFNAKMYLYPIPQSELDRNTGLKQNPGW